MHDILINWAPQETRVAVVENGTPVAGVVYAPARDELYEASLGGGARVNGAPARKAGSSARTRSTWSGGAAES